MKKFMEGHVCKLQILSTFDPNPHYMECSMLHAGKSVSISVWVYKVLPGKQWFWAKFSGEIVSGSFCVWDVSHLHA